MSQVHIHLLITHLPIFGSMLGVMVLLYAQFKKSEDTRIAAYGVLIAAALGAFIAFGTGEGAEDAVENLQGVNTNAIEAHEEFAEAALIANIALGAIALLAFLFAIRKSKFSGKAALLCLAIGFISIYMNAYTGYLGGKIRHTETGNSVIAPNNGQEESDDD